MLYLRLAWRELRSSPGRFAFVVLAVAVGVGALAGVRGFAAAFRAMLLSDARTLMAADLSARVFALPTAEQNAAMQTLERRGVRRTQVTETVTMAASPGFAQPLLVTLKAVDPAVYPFYGKLRLEPPARLDEHSAAVSGDLLARLNARVGQTLRLGGQPFRIVAVLASEPDRMTGTLNIGPRVMITRAGLARTGLITQGSRASERFLFRLPPLGISVEEARRTLKKALPEATIADFRETHPVVTRGLDRASTFLSLVALIAVIVGALGAGMAMHAHIQQRMETVAILKCLGARPRQVLGIFTTQALLVGAAGGALGVAFGLAVERVFPVFVERIFARRPELGFDAAAALESLAAGVFTTLLFALPPLLGLRQVRPSAVFRRAMPEEKRGAPWTAWAAGAVILAGLGVLAGSLARVDAWRLGMFFAVALAVGVAALAGMARLLLLGLRAAVAALRLSPTARHGIANLYRPGNQSTAVLVSMGVGVMFTLTVFLLQTSLLRQIVESLPPGMPNVFLLDIPAAERETLAAFAARQPGVERPPEVLAAVAVRLLRVDGTPVEKIRLQGFSRRFLRTRTVTWMAERPEGTQILGGAWWDAKSGPQVCVAEETAPALGVKPGSVVEWAVWGRTIRTRVACIMRPESIRMAARFEFLFSPGVLEGFPAIYYGGLRIRPSEVAAFQRALYERYPAVTVVNVADVLQTVQQVMDQIGMVYRFISLFTVAAAAIILAAGVAGTRFRRVRETAVLKALGATRRRVAAVFSVEYLLLGAVAGLMGALLANAFTAAVLKGLFDARYRFVWLPSAAAVAATAALAAMAGWAASYRILGMKPLEALREE
ncbi:MAG: ABC transporter permease [Bryobacteraceae bacterium]